MTGKIRRSVCALDCPDTCSLLVQVDDKTGRATKLAGDPNHPVTRGFLCGKVAQYLEREYHPDRLLHPMRRAGRKGEGRFERVSWDHAFAEITQRLERLDPESVLPYSYAGTMGILNAAGMDRRFFNRLGASKLARTICSEAGGVALLHSQGAKIGMAPDDYAHAKLIIAWGANILGTNVHLWPFIVEARRRGARFYVVDPVRNRTGRLADRHFALHPGSDIALALGIAHLILRDGLEDKDYVSAYANGFDEFAVLVSQYNPEHVSQLTGLPVAGIEELAREYATTKPAAIRLNYGVQRNDHGGAAVRAILSLPVLTGQWRHQGGGAQLSTSGAFAFNRAAVERPDLSTRNTRTVNMVQLGRALTELQDPPVRALIVYNSNPAAVAPDQNRVLQGLSREDLFTVVLEQFQTDTADHADIVLPVTTFLEHTDLYLAYGHYFVQMATPALAAPGEARSNFQIFRELAKRMGFTAACFDDTEEDVIRQALDSDSPYLQGIKFDHLKAAGFLHLNIAAQPFARGDFKTPSGRFEFGSETLHCRPPVESRHGDPDLAQRYPLELISSKNDDSMNSTFGHRDDVDGNTARLYLNPADAQARGIASNDPVRAFNERGSVELRACVSSDVKPGVVRVPSVRWAKRSPGAKGINVLTSDKLTDLGAGATFYSCLIEVELMRNDSSLAAGEVVDRSRA